MFKTTVSTHPKPKQFQDVGAQYDRKGKTYHNVTNDSIRKNPRNQPNPNKNPIIHNPPPKTNVKTNKNSPAQPNQTTQAHKLNMMFLFARFATETIL